MLTIGPFQLEGWHLLIIFAALMAFVWFAWGFLVPITGTWERVDEDKRPGVVERITLVQFGPFIRGRRKMKGGFQEYSGFLRGRSITIRRRDHGVPFIVSQGFPEGVAKDVDGTVTAILRLTLSADGTVIHGTFTPQKIEFVHDPPKITSRYFLSPSFRRYKLVSREPQATEVIEELEEAQKAAAAEATRPSKVRKTV
ncbi:MAG: hypothetical protein HY791_14795 [Deltaproteobacteria bacterium]|nr:hypothetical protein [Deltaproteobacteria bacterium]